jgi:hypothetical protein
MEPSKYVGESTLDEEGRLITPQDGEDETSDHEDREHKPVDRQGIKAVLTNLIQDEMQENFTVCNIEGYLHVVRGDEHWDEALDSSDDDTPPSLAARGNLCNDDFTHDNSFDDVPAPPLLQREMSSGDESSDDDQCHRKGYRSLP